MVILSLAKYDMLSESFKEALRGYGTRGFLTPEVFSIAFERRKKLINDARHATAVGVRWFCPDLVGFSL